MQCVRTCPKIGNILCSRFAWGLLKLCQNRWRTIFKNIKIQMCKADRDTWQTCAVRRGSTVYWCFSPDSTANAITGTRLASFTVEHVKHEAGSLILQDCTWLSSQHLILTILQSEKLQNFLSINSKMRSIYLRSRTWERRHTRVERVPIQQVRKPWWVSRNVGSSQVSHC